MIGIVFDIFRVLRRSFKTPDFVTYIHDFLFWILTGAILLFSIFTFNHGELRSYIFIGILLGIVIYSLIFSKYFMKILISFINILKKIIGYPIKVVSHFLKKYMLNPIYSILCKIKYKILKIRLKNKKTQNS